MKFSTRISVAHAPRRRGRRIDVLRPSRLFGSRRDRRSAGNGCHLAQHDAQLRMVDGGFISIYVIIGQPVRISRDTLAKLYQMDVIFS